MTEGLTIFTIAYNLETYVYPYRESIASAHEFAEEVIVADCQSDDGTHEALVELQKILPRLRLIPAKWKTADEGGNETILRDLANLCVSECRTPWTFYLNADEVIHERSQFPLQEMEQMGARFGQAKYTHFLGDFDTTFPFLYERVPRLACGRPVRWSNDACAIETYGQAIVDIPVDILHYGKVNVNRAEAAGIKELAFTALYKKHGFPDPTSVAVIEETGGMDFKRAVQTNWKKAGEKDQTQPFRGTHPKFVQDWIRRMKEAANV